MNYNFQKNLVRIWEQSVLLYQQGHQKPDNFPIDDEIPYLASMGIKKIDLFDFAEDWVCEQEPDLATFLLIHEQRRSYFLEVQKGIPSLEVLDPASLPAKSDSIEGINWLPRIIPKARAKLRGELHPQSMFCCGGDRNFFKTNDIHPVEFLRIVRNAGDQDQMVIDWVLDRSRQKNSPSKIK